MGETYLKRVLADLLILRSGPRMSRRIILDDIPDRAAKDRLISPIWSEDIGVVIHELIQSGAKGLFHVAPEESPVDSFTYWQAVATRFGRSVEACTLKGLDQAGQLGASTGLQSVKLAKHVGRSPRLWRSALSLTDAIEPKVPSAEVVMAGNQEVRRVEKPWGHEIIWAHTDRYVGKILFVKAGERLSLQYHEQKDETVYVLSGKMLFEVGPKDGEREDIIMKGGQSYHITPFTVHRMVAIEDTEILEASTPELDDVVRLEDSYGRAGTSEP